VTHAGRLEVPGQAWIESGIVAQGQAHQQPASRGGNSLAMDRPTNERHDWAARTNGLPTAEAAERRHADLRGDGPAVKGF
jgi:hypothetical protein